MRKEKRMGIGKRLDWIYNLQKQKQRTIEQAKRTVGELDSQLSQENALLVTDIQDGKTTGDRLLDVVIRAHHGYDSELFEKYRAFEERLIGKRGEFVLVLYDADTVNIRYLDGPRAAFSPHSLYESNNKAPFYRLGILDGEELVIPKIRNSLGLVGLALPVSRYVHGWVGLLVDKKDAGVEVIEENILDQWGSDYKLHPLCTYLDHPELLERTIIIGDEKVRVWLKEHCMEALFKPAADALGKLILEP